MKDLLKLLLAITVISIWVNIIFFTDNENEFRLKSKFLANDSTQILFSEMRNYVVSEYEGEIHETDNMSENIKFRNAIKNNDTIYVYYRYKGLIPIINWPVIKIGGRISTEIK